MSAEELLHAFYREAPYLFLGAAFTVSALYPQLLLFYAADAIPSLSSSLCLLRYMDFDFGFRHPCFQ
jgi:hypothetical protein